MRPLSYQEADVFLLCYKISDPISLYNVKNKWIRELRRHRTDVPVILCGCQSEQRSDPLTIAHLSKTGRTPVSQEQALAICCEIEALHYVETSAKNADKDNSEAFEVCALAAIKHKNAKNNNNNNVSKASTFKRSPSVAVRAARRRIQAKPVDPFEPVSVGQHAHFRPDAVSVSDAEERAAAEQPKLVF